MDKVETIFTKRVDRYGRVTVPADIRAIKNVTPGGYVTLELHKFSNNDSPQQTQA